MLFWNKSIIRNALLGIYSLLFSSILFASASIEGIQVYSQDIDFSWERKQRIADDLDRYNNADNIWDVLRQEFTLPHYEDNPLVQKKIEWFLEHQNYLVNSMNRAAPYLYYISQQTKKRHLPAELVLLPIIESAYNVRPNRVIRRSIAIQLRNKKYPRLSRRPNNPQKFF